MHGQAVLERQCADEQAAVRARTMSPSAPTAARIPPSHAPMTVASIQRLQALAGNRAVSALLAPATQRPRSIRPSGARPRHGGRSQAHVAVQREDMGIPTEQPAGLSPRFADDDNLQDVFNGRKFMSFGWYGCSVKKVQQALIEAGHELPEHDVDGDFRTETRAAVVAFQKSQDGLAADGIVGRLTLDRLQKSVAPTPVRPVDCYIPPKQEEKKDDDIITPPVTITPCHGNGKCNPRAEVDDVWKECGPDSKCIPVPGEPCGVCATNTCHDENEKEYQARVRQCKRRFEHEIAKLPSCVAKQVTCQIKPTPVCAVKTLECYWDTVAARRKANKCLDDAYHAREKRRKVCDSHA